MTAEERNWLTDSESQTHLLYSSSEKTNKIVAPFVHGAIHEEIWGVVMEGRLVNNMMKGLQLFVKDVDAVLVLKTIMNRDAGSHNADKFGMLMESPTLPFEPSSHSLLGGGRGGRVSLGVDTLAQIIIKVAEDEKKEEERR